MANKRRNKAKQGRRQEAREGRRNQGKQFIPSMQSSEVRLKTGNCQQAKREVQHKMSGAESIEDKKKT